MRAHGLFTRFEAELRIPSSCRSLDRISGIKANRDESLLAHRYWLPNISLSIDQTHPRFWMTSARGNTLWSNFHYEVHRYRVPSAQRTLLSSRYRLTNNEFYHRYTQGQILIVSATENRLLADANPVE